MSRSWSLLPFEILYNIFSFFEDPNFGMTYNLTECQLVCKVWNKAAKQHMYSSVFTYNEYHRTKYAKAIAHSTEDLGSYAQEITVSNLNSFGPSTEIFDFFETVARLCVNLKKIRSFQLPLVSLPPIEPPDLKLYELPPTEFYTFLIQKHQQGHFRHLASIPPSGFTSASTAYVQALFEFRETLTEFMIYKDQLDLDFMRICRPDCIFPNVKDLLYNDWPLRTIEELDRFLDLFPSVETMYFLCFRANESHAPSTDLHNIPHTVIPRPKATSLRYSTFRSNYVYFDYCMAKFPNLTTFYGRDWVIPREFKSTSYWNSYAESMGRWLRYVSKIRHHSYSLSCAHNLVAILACFFGPEHPMFTDEFVIDYTYLEKSFETDEQGQQLPIIDLENDIGCYLILKGKRLPSRNSLVVSYPSNMIVSEEMNSDTVTHPEQHWMHAPQTSAPHCELLEQAGHGVYHLTLKSLQFLSCEPHVPLIEHTLVCCPNLKLLTIDCADELDFSPLKVLKEPMSLERLTFSRSLINENFFSRLSHSLNKIKQLTVDRSTVANAISRWNSWKTTISMPRTVLEHFVFIRHTKRSEPFEAPRLHASRLKEAQYYLQVKRYGKETEYYFGDFLASSRNGPRKSDAKIFEESQILSNHDITSWITIQCVDLKYVTIDVGHFAHLPQIHTIQLS
ncbi:MAG: hypothetical protein EXX96DRAFT_569134 [Benjaminiella poitrasii]|nr:MAG: hypothetical protein EXX96DRAFT_569134 [Benjaminiella poitrasii]